MTNITFSYKDGILFWKMRKANNFDRKKEKQMKE